MQHDPLARFIIKHGKRKRPTQDEGKQTHFESWQESLKSATLFSQVFVHLYALDTSVSWRSQAWKKVAEDNLKKHDIEKKRKAGATKKRKLSASEAKLASNSSKKTRMSSEGSNKKTSSSQSIYQKRQKKTDSKDSNNKGKKPHTMKDSGKSSSTTASKSARSMRTQVSTQNGKEINVDTEEEEESQTNDSDSDGDDGDDENGNGGDVSNRKVSRLRKKPEVKVAKKKNSSQKKMLKIQSSGRRKQQIHRQKFLVLHAVAKARLQLHPILAVEAGAKGPLKIQTLTMTTIQM